MVIGICVIRPLRGFPFQALCGMPPTQIHGALGTAENAKTWRFRLPTRNTERTHARDNRANERTNERRGKREGTQKRERTHSEPRERTRKQKHQRRTQKKKRTERGRKEGERRGDGAGPGSQEDRGNKGYKHTVVRLDKKWFVVCESLGFLKSPSIFLNNFQGFGQTFQD